MLCRNVGICFSAVLFVLYRMFYDALLQVGIAVNMSCSSLVSSLNFWEFSVYSIDLLSTEPVFCLLSCFQR